MATQALLLFLDAALTQNSLWQALPSNVGVIWSDRNLRVLREGEYD